VANFREEILRQTYPRIANLQEQVQLTYWNEYHLVPQDLLDILLLPIVITPTSQEIQT